MLRLLISTWVPSDTTTSEDPMTQILDELDEHNVDGAVVRLIIKATEAQEILLDDKPIRQALRNASYIASIIRDVERAQRHRLGNVSAEELTPQQVLDLYLDLKETPAERKTELLRYAEALGCSIRIALGEPDPPKRRRAAG